MRRTLGLKEKFCELKTLIVINDRETSALGSVELVAMHMILNCDLDQQGQRVYTFNSMRAWASETGHVRLGIIVIEAVNNFEVGYGWAWVMMRLVSPSIKHVGTNLTKTITKRFHGSHFGNAKQMRYSQQCGPVQSILMQERRRTKVNEMRDPTTRKHLTGEVWTPLRIPSSSSSFSFSLSFFIFFSLSFFSL